MASFGENLRRERELRGVTLPELANATKINPRHLAALERDQFDRLPGGVFNRGFVRAVARYMKLDENYWVSEYARAAGEEVETLSRYATNGARTPSAQPSKWLFVSLVALFAAGAYLVHDARLRRAAEAAMRPAAPPVESAQTAAAPASATAENPLLEVSAPLTPTNAPTPAAPSGAEQVTALTRELRLQVDVVEDSWVKVAVDDSGGYEGRVKPGEPRRFRAGQRIELTTDNASAVVLTLNGETLPPLGQPGERKTIVITAKEQRAASP